MSRDFELGRNVSCEESTASPLRGYFLACGCSTGIGAFASFLSQVSRWV